MPRMQEERFRNKVSWVMFVFSILVIWVHSYNVKLFAGGLTGPLWDRAAQIEDFVSVGIGQLAVPGFFLLSSYLFFRNYTPSLLMKKWKGRFQSIIVPYVVWNSLYYFGYVLATRLPLVKNVVGKAMIPFGPAEYLNAVLHYNYAPIFWYLYQLILLIILSPVIYWLVKERIIGAIYLAALVAAIHFHLDMQHPNTDALFYYSTAAYLSIHGKQVAERIWDRKQAAAGIGFLAIAIFCFYQMGRPGADVLWTVFYRLVTPVSLWLLINEAALKTAKPWMNQSLYLYAVHYVIVRFVNKGGIRVLLCVPEAVVSEGILAVSSLVIYFLLPVIVVWLSYGSARLLCRFVPAVWKVLSGGRSLEG